MANDKNAGVIGGVYPWSRIDWIAMLPASTRIDEGLFAFRSGYKTREGVTVT
jgi:hypothetical protein